MHQAINIWTMDFQNGQFTLQKQCVAHILNICLGVKTALGLGEETFQKLRGEGKNVTHQYIKPIYKTNVQQYLVP